MHLLLLYYIIIIIILYYIITVHKSVSFDRCMHLQNHHCNQDTEHFHHSQVPSRPFAVNLFLCFSPLVATHLFSVTKEQFAFFSGLLYKWNHAVDTLLYLASFTLTVWDSSTLLYVSLFLSIAES